MLRAFAPILRPGGRLLVVASDFGSLRRLPAHLHERFDTDAMSLDDVDATMLAWRDAVVAGRAAEEGWPEWINVPSKVGQVAAVRVLARERRAADARDGTLRRRDLPRTGRHGGVASVVRGHAARRRRPPRPRSPRCASRSIAPRIRAVYGELVQFGKVIPWR